MSDPELLLAGLEARADWQATSGLDSRTYSLVKIACADRARRAAGLLPVAGGQRLDAGCTPTDLLGVLHRGRAAGRRPENGRRRAGTHGCPRPYPARRGRRGRRGSRPGPDQHKDEGGKSC